jgi:uncharacterized protein YndB with AHSA1/START domain
MAESKADKSTRDREIVITRVFHAPRESVWNAWTDSQNISRWWGPNGFTTTTHVMDVRPGGMWRYIMHGPDGVDWKNRIDYVEVVKPERLVYVHGDDDEGAQPPFHVTISFAEQAGGTKVTMQSVFASAAECKRVKGFGAVAGGNQTLARLDEYLANLK